MLNKSCIKFLEYLLTVENIKLFEFFNYFSVNNIDYKTAKNYLKYLINEGYIKIIKKTYVIPTFKTKIFFLCNQETKLNKIFITYFLPYIQQFTMFLLGLITPYLLKILKYIAEYFGII